MANFFAPAIACALGAAIWLLSPAITGHREAWDAPGPYFPVALVVAGVIAGALKPCRPWRAGMWIYLGQVTAMLLMSRGDFGLLPLGLVVLVGFTLLSVAAAAVGGWLCRLTKKP